VWPTDLASAGSHAELYLKICRRADAPKAAGCDWMSGLFTCTFVPLWPKCSQIVVIMVIMVIMVTMVTMVNMVIMEKDC
jgi:hypothetical protein